MALSNMLREPRRELTESAVGIGALGAIIVLPAYADYQFAVWWNSVDNTPIPLAMFMGLLSASVLIPGGIALLVAAHALGDRICDALDRRGLHLRPVRRYQL